MTLRQRLAPLLGLAGVTGRLRVLFAVVIPAGLLAAFGVALLYPLPAWRPAEGVRLLLSFGVVVLAQVARVHVGHGATRVSVGWGEAALIILFCLIPPGLVPATFLVGVALGQVVLWLAGSAYTAVTIAYNAANLTIAAAVATVVARPLLPSGPMPPDPRIATALVLGALVYVAVNVLLFSATLSVNTGTSLVSAVNRLLIGKYFMVVGNIAVGLLVVVTSDEDPRWLLVLPPVLWLVRQSYGNRLRADDERRGWQDFSRATEALNRLEERGVGEAGVHGAARLFPAATAEVLVVRTDGSLWSYRGGRESAVVSGPAVDPPPAGEPAGRRPPGTQPACTTTGTAGGPRVPADRRPGRRSPPPSVVARPLQVGGMAVGELRLHFPVAVQLSPREQMQLSAFADALAAALHDAAAHREMQDLSARSVHAAAHDGLTGIANRDALLALGDGALRVLPREHPVALLLVDIDHFKEVNDTLGHAAGDDLLRILAQRIAGHAGDEELVARLSGDEFGLLVTSLTGPAAVDEEPPGCTQALRRGQELADLIAMPTEVTGIQLAVEGSVGVVVAPAGSVDMTELLRRAYIAMYRAKRGGGTVGWYDGRGDDGSTDRLALLAELREALRGGQQLVLALQPAVDLGTGVPTGVEALIRWRHPRRGELPPKEFMRVLENSDLVGVFTRYVVDRALALAADWAAHDVPVPVSVNLSPRSLLDADLPDQLAELLARHRVPPSRLILEITETVVVPEHEAISGVLDGLQRLGVQLAVDDFGTGYSSLKFLTRVRVQEIKVDRTFVARMVDSPEVAAIIKTTVDLAGRLGVRVVAEGVETAEQRAALIDLGCTSAQGFYFFRPIPAEKITGVLVGQTRSAGGQVIPLRTEGAS